MKSVERDVTIIRCNMPDPEQEKCRRKGMDPQLKEFMTMVVRLAALALSSIGVMYLMGWAH